MMSREWVFFTDIENMELYPASTSGHSFVNVGRNGSIASTNATGEPIVTGPSSSVDTTLYQSDPTLTGVSSLTLQDLGAEIPILLEDYYFQSQYRGGEYVEGEGNEFIDFALLSHLAVRLRDRVPRGIHVKNNLTYSRAFTGKDIVVSVS